MSAKGKSGGSSSKARRPNDAGDIIAQAKAKWKDFEDVHGEWGDADELSVKFERKKANTFNSSMPIQPKPPSTNRESRPQRPPSPRRQSTTLTTFSLSRPTSPTQSRPEVTRKASSRPASPSSKDAAAAIAKGRRGTAAHLVKPPTPKPEKQRFSLSKDGSKEDGKGKGKSEADGAKSPEAAAPKSDEDPANKHGDIFGRRKPKKEEKISTRAVSPRTYVKKRLQRNFKETYTGILDSDREYGHRRRIRVISNTSTRRLDTAQSTVSAGVAITPHLANRHVLWKKAGQKLEIVKLAAVSASRFQKSSGEVDSESKSTKRMVGNTNWKSMHSEALDVLMESQDTTTPRASPPPGGEDNEEDPFEFSTLEGPALDLEESLTGKFNPLSIFEDKHTVKKRKSNSVYLVVPLEEELEFEEDNMLSPDGFAIIKKGVRLYNSGKLEEARQMFGKAVDRNLANSITYSYRAQVLCDLAMYEEMLQDASTALHLNKEDVFSAEMKGRAEFFLGRFDESAKTFLTALDANPSVHSLQCGYDLALFALRKKRKLKKAKPKPHIFEVRTTPRPENPNDYDRYILSVNKRAEGGMEGGTGIYIYGYGFAEADESVTVTVHGELCEDIQVWDNHTITAVTPPSTSAYANISAVVVEVGAKEERYYDGANKDTIPEEGEDPADEIAKNLEGSILPVREDKAPKTYFPKEKGRCSIVHPKTMFHYVAPSIITLNPSHGPIDGLTRVRVRGTAMGIEKVAVTIGGFRVPPKDIKVILGNKEIEFITPPVEKDKIVDVQVSIQKESSETHEYCRFRYEGKRAPGELVDEVIVDDSRLPLKIDDEEIQHVDTEFRDIYRACLEETLEKHLGDIKDAVAKLFPRLRGVFRLYCMTGMVKSGFDMTKRQWQEFVRLTDMDNGSYILAADINIIYTSVTCDVSSDGKKATGGNKFFLNFKQFVELLLRVCDRKFGHFKLGEDFQNWMESDIFGKVRELRDQTDWYYDYARKNVREKLIERETKLKEIFLKFRNMAEYVQNKRELVEFKEMVNMAKYMGIYADGTKGGVKISHVQLQQEFIKSTFGFWPTDSHGEPRAMELKRDMTVEQRGSISYEEFEELLARLACIYHGVAPEESNYAVYPLEQMLDEFLNVALKTYSSSMKEIKANPAAAGEITQGRSGRSRSITAASANAPPASLQGLGESTSNLGSINELKRGESSRGLLPKTGSTRNLLNKTK